MKSELERDILKILIGREDIQRRVSELGDALYSRFAGKNPLFLCVLKGSLVFTADLVRACQLQCEMECIAVSSYRGGATSAGRLNIVYDLQSDITGRDVIVVEDILDSGKTLSFLAGYLKAKGASSVTIVTLLDKPARRTEPVEADYIGFIVPDEFVVGYGLDYDQRFRNLPYIGVLRPEAIH